MATGTFNEFCNGRVGFIGLGIGYKARVEQYFGLKIAKHVTTAARMKDHFSYKGNFFDFQDFPKLVDKKLNIPILFGSSGDKMLKLAGKIADGVIINSIA
jgi:alkanesulfonate monooxygenase SsuD/methylene tetrahydromethanopterin reductase-like flavin-dependent oxidoreductase (luciferase family)